MKKITAIFWIIATIAFFFITPVSFIRNTVTSGNQVSYDQPIPSIAHGYQISQQFIPQYDYIEHIEVYVNTLNCDKNQGYLLARVLDTNQTMIYENSISLASIPDYGWLPIVSDISLNVGNTYYLTLDAIDTIDDGPVITFYANSLAASSEEKNQLLTYAGFPLENSVLRIRFTYNVLLSRTDYITYYFFLFFLIFMFLSKLPARKK